MIKTAAATQALISKSLMTAEGRKHIASALTEPLRRRQDYEVIGRKAFMEDRIVDGQLPYYDKDPEIAAYVVGEEGDSVQQIIKGDRVLVPLFELATWVGIPYTQVKERRYDVVNRVKVKTKSEIFRKEDRIVFGIMDRALPTENVVTVARSALNMEVVTEAFALIEANGNRVANIFMNARNFQFFRNAGRDYLPFETQAELLKTGFQGVLWGANVYLTPEAPEDKIYFCAEPETFGVCSIRQDLTVLPADDTKNRKFGWSVFEQLGFLITSADWNLSAIKITA